MNEHLIKARELVARGDEFYARAADELIAAGVGNPGGTSYREAAEAVGKSETWCKDIVRLRTNGQDLTSPWSHDTPRRTRDAAKQVLRSNPAVVTELDPGEQREVARKLDEAAAKREHARKQDAKQKEREHLGDETVDDLELREELQSVEYLLISARGNLRGFVKRAGELGVENTPEAWRESCLDWVADLEGHLGMAKALLGGDDIDWAAFEELLAKES